MRIAEAEVSGFRGFGSRVVFDMDADAVLVIAPNGQGKTSLFDAILWCLTGTVPRLNCDDSKLLSLYSDTGEMEVRVKIRRRDGNSYSITRSSDGKTQRLSFQEGQDVTTGAGATTELLETLWPMALTTNESLASLAGAITRCVYLQQDSVPYFVESQSEQERFNAISDLVGSGSITDLQVQLDNARSAWSRATNDMLPVERTRRERVLSLEAQAAKLATRTPTEPPLHPEWEAWWAELRRLGIEPGKTPNLDSSEATLIIDSALKQLQARRSAADRLQMLVERLVTDIRLHTDDGPPDTQELAQKAGEAERALNSARQRLETARESSRAELVERMKQGTSEDELKSLAELALGHLGERCPVCDQPYDKAKTTQRLQSLAQSRRKPIVLPGRQLIDDLATEVDRHDRDLANIQAQLAQATLAQKNHADWVVEQDRRLRELGVHPDPSTNALKQ